MDCKYREIMPLFEARIVDAEGASALPPRGKRPQGDRSYRVDL